MGGKTRLSIALLGAIAAAMALTFVIPAFGASSPDAVHLILGSDNPRFEYDGATQPITTPKNGCQINTPEENLIDLSSSNGGTSPGFASDSVGVKSGGSNSNGTPCSQIDGTETLTIRPGAELSARTFAGVRLDLEMTGDAVVELVFHLTSGGAETYLLQTGTSITACPGAPGCVDNNPSTPYYEVDTSTPGISACAAPNSSGPNSGGNDNCLWRVDRSGKPPASQIDLTVVNIGTVSLEGGADTAGNASLFYLANQVPIAENDSAQTDEDHEIPSIDVLTNDTDADGDALSVIAVNATGTVGTVGFTSDDVSYDPNGQFEFLGTGDQRSDTFTYTISDGTATAEATVTVTVTGVNDPPVVGRTSFTGEEDSPVDIDLELQDPDDTSFITSCSSGEGTFLADTSNGGTGTFTPTADFAGDATLFCTVNDSEITVLATVTVNLIEVNDAPVAADDSYETDERSSASSADTLTVTAPGVLGNDTDIDGPALTVSAVNGASTNDGANVTLDDGLGNSVGILTTQSDGSFGYTPDLTYPWGPDEFVRTDTWQYTVSDGALSDTATVSITVYRVVCSGETVSDTDGDVTGSFTLISSEVPCKRYSVDAQDEGSGTSETVTFDSDGAGTADFRGFLSFEPQVLDPGTGTFALGLEYDPDGPGEAGFQTMQVCIAPIFDGAGLVTSATLPDGESWCWASALSTAVGSSGEIQTVHQIYGEEDPIFRVK